ncbi:MAG: hypothetical protein WC800_07000 [Candidatus Nanopelagicaceae bacterium]|jgi:dolichol-phosphate mannosyltransferase
MQSEREIISFILSGSSDDLRGELIARIKSFGNTAEKIDLDAEFIVVVAYSETKLQDELKAHAMNHPIQIVVVGERNSWDQEMFAGLSRANGDYSLVIGNSTTSMDATLPHMLDLARSQNSDLVGLRDTVTSLAKLKHLRTTFLYSVLRRRIKAPLSIGNFCDLLITRKALNWILRDLSSAQCIIEMYLVPGLNFGFIEAGSSATRYKLSGNMFSRLITRYTHVPLTVLRSCFYLTTFVALAISANALSVRWRGVNLLNHVEQEVPGWTTLVLLMSFGFSVTIYALYILLRTILHLAQEYSTKPNYIIKSVQRP